MGFLKGGEIIMYVEHHDLDPYPIPKEKSPLYINGPKPESDSA